MVIDTIAPGELHEIARIADLVVIGTVASVLPAASAPDHPNIIRTDSVISVKQVLYGAQPSPTITLTQLGGQVGPCGIIVPDDPLVSRNEEYVFFLNPEPNLLPANTSGFPRYSAVGAWSGKVKLVNGKVQFLPSVTRLLREKYDNTDANDFLAELTRIIGILHPKR